MINIRSKREIEAVARSSRVVAMVLNRIRNNIVPGITTRELDALAEKWIRETGAEPAFKGYRGYPATLCVSINEEVVHGIPSNRKLKEGQIVSIDVGAKLNGFYGDGAYTFPVGKVSEEAEKLLKVTEEALYRGIEKARAGNRLHDISNAIQTWVEKHGFSVVRDFVGHGIGSQLHESPQIPNYGKAGTGPLLSPGMIFAIEPMVNAGTYKVKILSNGWTAVTEDGSLSAHFEHTIAITEKGPVILTKLAADTAFAEKSDNRNKG